MSESEVGGQLMGYVEGIGLHSLTVRVPRPSHQRPVSDGRAADGVRGRFGRLTHHGVGVNACVTHTYPHARCHRRAHLMIGPLNLAWRGVACHAQDLVQVLLRPRRRGEHDEEGDEGANGEAHRE